MVNAGGSIWVSQQLLKVLPCSYQKGISYLLRQHRQLIYLNFLYIFWSVNFLKIHIIFCPPICPRSIHLSLSHSHI